VRFHQIVGLFVAAAATVLIAPAAAHAETYPVEPPASTISDGTVSDGGMVTFSGKGFLPYERISITIGYGGSDSAAAMRDQPAGGFVLAALNLPELAKMTVTADGQGAFSVQVPLSQAGTATLLATGLTSGVVVTAKVKVLASGDKNTNNNASSGGGLPTTGPGGAPLLVAVGGGAGAVLIGGALILLARIRRRV
jgi:hypothetical protein